MRSGKSPFKGRQFTAEVILWALRSYLQFPISYRDLERMLADRGVVVDHTTIFRWIQAYAPELDRRIRPSLRMTNGSWRVDETYVKVKGRWMYLYRAVDARGQTIDFRLCCNAGPHSAEWPERKRDWAVTDFKGRHFGGETVVILDGVGPMHPRLIAANTPAG